MSNLIEEIEGVLFNGKSTQTFGLLPEKRKKKKKRAKTLAPFIVDDFKKGNKKLSDLKKVYCTYHDESENNYFKQCLNDELDRLGIGGTKSLINRKNKIDVAYKELAGLSPEEYRAAAGWLQQHTINIKFRVPKIDDDLAKLDTSAMSLEAGDKLRAEIFDRFANLEREFRDAVPAAKLGRDFSYRYTSRETDTNYKNWWNLSGSIYFDELIKYAPEGIIKLIKIAQEKVVHRRADLPPKPIEQIKEEDFVDSYYFCLMVLKMFDGDIQFFRKKPAIDDNNPFDLDFDSVNAYGESLRESKKEICCICGEEIDGYGNNPEPYKHEGRCCDSCNAKFVIPARLAALETKEEE